MAKLKFGSPAWRAKYMKKNKSKRKATRQNKSQRTTRTTKKTVKKTRSNPPRTWTKVSQMRVVKKNGREVVEWKK